jgi:hypothetical protein
MTSTITGRQFMVSGLFRVGLIGLVIILLLGSTEQARSAGSLQWEEPGYLMAAYARDILDKGYVCVGDEMQVDVQVGMNVEIGPKDDRGLIPVMNIKLVGFPVFADVLGGRGNMNWKSRIIEWHIDKPTPEAKFIYKATKEGHEKIRFRTLVPKIGTRPSVYLEDVLEFDVKKCKQKVNLILDGQLSDEGVAWSGIGLIEDAIVEQGEDGVYRGSADFEFNVFNHATTDGGCVYQPHTAIAQAEITGQPNKDVMTWTLTYQDAQESVTATCVDTGTQTFDNLQPLSEYGPSVVTISSSGGAARYSQSWSWPTGGEFATYTIIVEPVEEKSVSRTGDPAWLSGWFEAALFLLAEGQ